MIPVAGLTTSGVIPLSSVTVRTYAASTQDTSYRTVDGASSDSVESMPVHPATSRQIANLPEAFRETETIVCYPPASSALRRAAGSRPPRVLYQSRWYAVTGRDGYDEQGGASIVLASLVEVVAP